VSAFQKIFCLVNASSNATTYYGYDPFDATNALEHSIITIFSSDWSIICFKTVVTLSRLYLKWLTRGLEIVLLDFAELKYIVAIPPLMHDKSNFQIFMGKSSLNFSCSYVLWVFNIFLTQYHSLMRKTLSYYGENVACGFKSIAYTNYCNTRYTNPRFALAM